MKARLPYFLLFLFVVFVGIGSHVQAQHTAEQSVISSAGNSEIVETPSRTFLIDWTIGEPLIESLQGSAKRLTQGFHQSRIIVQSTHIFSVLDHENIRHFNVFPNPFVSHISVKWNFSESMNLLFEVFTQDGRRVFSQRQNAADSQLLIHLPNLTPSTYILRISDPQRNFSESHKLIKF